jgi:hypothetical protein
VTEVSRPAASYVFEIGGGTIVFSVALTLCDRLPLTPLNVNVEDPVGVPGAAVTVSVLVPEPATVVGLKEAVACEGSPATDKLTVPAKPFVAVMVAK